MAPSTRRSSRRVATQANGADNLPAVVDEQTGSQEAPIADTCPACKPEDDAEGVGKETWIRCDACKEWFHWVCVGEGGDHEAVDKWYDKACLESDPSRSITLKPPARKSTRKRTQRDYANLNDGVESDPNKWIRIIQKKPISDDRFRRMKGSEVSLEWLASDETAMTEPIVIENPDGLGMNMPPKEFTVQDVADTVGRDTPVEVIDVASQSNSPNWTLGKWAEYYNTAPEQRDKIRNVISLEISGSKLAEQVLPPRLVREIDWVEKFWPPNRRQKGTYPKVQLYCLMSVAQCWTDWHIDFAGSSVYYHIFRGSKTFYFIRPTPANLSAYEKWSGTEVQNHMWLGDMVDEVIKVELTEGNTMIIPTGWIHAVHTPSDSLVFGGNFLHSYNVATQLRVRDIEIATRVPKKFRFPLFQRLCWYVGEKYLRDIKAKEEFPPRVLRSIDALATFLVSEARLIERGPDQSRRDSKEAVPSDRVKEPGMLARELRWRVRLAAGAESDDELGVEKTGKKRKRPLTEPKGDSELAPTPAPAIYRNWKPQGWDGVEKTFNEPERVMVRRPNLGEADNLKAWFQSEGDTNWEVATQHNEVVRWRRLETGALERETVTRVLERFEIAQIKMEVDQPPVAPAENGVPQENGVASGEADST